jgi:hypothetical protein
MKSVPKYHQTISNIQDLVDTISRDTASTRILGESIEEYVSTILDEILDANPELFGETNHMSYFKEGISCYEVSFENIGKVRKCTFRFNKEGVDLEEELTNSLWGVYTHKLTYEGNYIPTQRDANHFAKMINTYFNFSFDDLKANRPA